MNEMELGDPLIGGITLQMALILLGFLTFIGVVIWAMKIPNLKNLGMGMTLVPLALVFILIISMAVTPAITVVPDEDQPMTSDVLSVAVIHGNFTQSDKLITAVVVTNSTTPSMNNSATHILVNFTVQRTDSGPAYDVKQLTCSYSPSTLTSPSTGISYSVARPAADGRPNVNWTITQTAVTTASRTLTTQAGMTPFETINVAVNIDYNYNAFGISSVAANDVISLGTVNIGGEIYTLQVVVNAVWT
jgi:hypothetical protein